MSEAILLSGGMDSICLAYHLRPKYAYTVDYGQVCAKREISVSAIVCEYLKIEHRIISINCSALGSGLLANKDASSIAPSTEWWPFRNQMLVTFGLMRAVKDNVQKLYLASVKSDSFHLDGTQEFYRLINSLTIYQEGKIKVECPTINYYTHELAIEYKVPSDFLLLAHSCHVSNIACGVCSGCLKQLNARQLLGIE